VTTGDLIKTQSANQITAGFSTQNVFFHSKALLFSCFSM